MYSIAALSHKITLHGIQLTQPHDNIRIDCRAWWEVKQKIEIAIASAIKLQVGDIAYWALTHYCYSAVSLKFHSSRTIHYLLKFSNRVFSACALREST